MSDHSIFDTETLIKSAAKLYENEEYLQAAAAYRQAADAFLAKNDSVNQAECLNNCSVAFLRGGDAKAAFEVAEGTEKAFAEVGDFQRQAMALGNQAAALEELKQTDQALELFRLSSTLFKQNGDTEFQSFVLKRISALKMKQGKRIESMAAMDAALHIKQKPSLREKFMRSLFDLLFNLIKRPPLPM